MINDTVDWSQNCLTGGIHNGRDGKLWAIPLGYAVVIFDAETLRELVIERIYSDAMQVVEHSDKHSQAWADAIKHYAELMYMNKLQHKVGELSNYYKSANWRSDQQGAVRRVKEGTLNVNYEPLHGHDTINLFCRIVAVSASGQVS